MRKGFSLASLVVLFVPVLGLGQSEKLSPDSWVDFAAGDYDIHPNISYATANNTALKLDLYLPKDHSAPSPTLVYFHGGGWVAGQKRTERPLPPSIFVARLGCGQC